ncbi:hypothetical protein BR93DRAFT_985576 [Coniochaeta sp. PMI_546]|nr:hypothetical protein BR93DRAFT_985576 [Coniochaeta sp. PMI_546]
MACDGCAISLLKTRLEMPLTTPSSVAWSIPATTAATATSSTPTHTNGCDGKTYTVKQGDTCLSVSLSQGIYTVQLLATNDLIAGCSDFPQSGSLCIPTVWTCKPHQIKDGETCNTIAKASNVTRVQLISWNPELGKSCENIARLGNSAICISTPGGPWVDPFPSSSTPSGISTTPDTIFTLPMTTLPASAMVPSIRVSTIWGDNDEL